MNGEILIFAKGPLVSFIYGVIDVFAFPKEYVRGTFDKNDILKCCLYLILTDADSTALFFVFVRKIQCSITND